MDSGLINFELEIVVTQGPFQSVGRILFVLRYRALHYEYVDDGHLSLLVREAQRTAEETRTWTEVGYRVPSERAVSIQQCLTDLGLPSSTPAVSPAPDTSDFWTKISIGLQLGEVSTRFEFETSPAGVEGTHAVAIRKLWRTLDSITDGRLHAIVKI